jgi:hypothetical protein
MPPSNYPSHQFELVFVDVHAELLLGDDVAVLNILFLFKMWEVKARGPAINPLQKLDKKSKVRGIIPINL